MKTRLSCDSYYYKLWHSHLENCSCVVFFIETIWINLDPPCIEKLELKLI